MNHDLQIERWPVERLIPFARNARTHSDEQVMQIAASIAEFGWTNPILAGSDCVIIAGHARLLAARRLGLTEVPVIVLDHLTTAQRRALVMADNKLALNAGWNEEMLRIELEDLREEEFNLDLIGFSDDELAQILSDTGEPEQGNTDEDAAPEAPEEPVTVPGDVWLLGRHRLLCGDATKNEDVARLMGDEKADLLFTDPPYGVGYEGYTPDRLTIEGDRMTPEQFREFLAAAFASCGNALKPTASVYICYADRWQREMLAACETAGFALRCTIIWAKNTFAWGFARYKFQHEAIFHGHIAGETDPWYGDKTQSTLWQENKPAANRLHPTMKPVELIERAIRNSSRKDDIVVDLFGGSGSTMIACERMRRSARLMEIDPRYCDVSIRRWQEFSGKAVKHSDSGRQFDELADERAPARVA